MFITQQAPGEEAERNLVIELVYVSGPLPGAAHDCVTDTYAKANKSARDRPPSPTRDVPASAARWRSETPFFRASLRVGAAERSVALKSRSERASQSGERHGQALAKRFPDEGEPFRFRRQRHLVSQPSRRISRGPFTLPGLPFFCVSRTFQVFAKVIGTTESSFSRGAPVSRDEFN